VLVSRVITHLELSLPYVRKDPVKRYSRQALTSVFIKAFSTGLFLAVVCFLPVWAQDSGNNTAVPLMKHPTCTKSASDSDCQEVDSASLSTAPAVDAATPDEDGNDAGKSLLTVDCPDYKAIANRYLDYHKALLKAKRLKELVPYRMQVFQDQYNQTMAPGKFKAADNPDLLLPLIQAMEPRNIKITKILIKDDWAQLHAEGLDAGALIEGMNKGLNKIGEDLSKALGNVGQPGQEKTVTFGSTQLHKENGFWQIGKERWSSKTFTVPSTESIKN
jgi:hypothetical protein